VTLVSGVDDTSGNTLASAGPITPTDGIGDVTAPTGNVTAPKAGGGPHRQHLTRPTFGLDHNTGAQMVENGFTLNGQSYMVTHNYHTPIPMHYIDVGETNEFVAKVYAQRGLSVMKFLFGIPEVGQAHNAEAYIMVRLSHDGTIKDITVSNSDDLIIDPDSLSITLPQAVRCTESATVERCMQLSASVKFNESPKAEIFALQAVDFKLRAHTTYFNEGVEIQGESLNPPTTIQIPSEQKGVGLITLQRVDKINDIWVPVDDADHQLMVLKYKKNSADTFIPIERKSFERFSDDIQKVMTRLNSNFALLQQDEIDRAVLVFDASKLESELPDSFAYDFPKGMTSQEGMTLLKPLMYQNEIHAALIFDSSELQNFRNP